MNRITTRQLTAEEREQLFKPLFKKVIRMLSTASDGDAALLWALQRKLRKEVMYLERGTPQERRKLKALKRKEQNNKCLLCGEVLPERNIVLDRIRPIDGYTPENVRLLCSQCDTNEQIKKGYA